MTPRDDSNGAFSSTISLADGDVETGCTKDDKLRFLEMEKALTRYRNLREMEYVRLVFIASCVWWLEYVLVKDTAFHYMFVHIAIETTPMILLVASPSTLPQKLKEILQDKALLFLICVGFIFRLAITFPVVIIAYENLPEAVVKSTVWELPLVVRLVTAYLLAGFLAWIGHRAAHYFTVLKYFHQFHHFASTRTHFTERIHHPLDPLFMIQHVASVVFLKIFSQEEHWIMLTIGLLSNLSGNAPETEIPDPFKLILYGGEHHVVHHEEHFARVRKNYSFPLIDYIMGTYEPHHGNTCVQFNMQQRGRPFSTLFTEVVGAEYYASRTAYEEPDEEQFLREMTSLLQSSIAKQHTISSAGQTPHLAPAAARVDDKPSGSAWQLGAEGLAVERVAAAETEMCTSATVAAVTGRLCHIDHIPLQVSVQ